MSNRMNWLLLFAVAVCVGLTVSANAAIVIPTNQNGADAEVRESQQSVDLGGLVSGTNRGTNTEAATRVSAGGGRSSTSFFKFDISGLPDSSDVAFWSSKNVWFQANVRHENLVPSRLFVGPSTRMEFMVYGLDPNGTYSTARTDRSGNAYASPNYAYNWVEGDGSGNGITYYDAPGITPHCMVQGSCAGADPNDTQATLGYLDDFDANALPLGTWNWPWVAPQNHLPVGLPLNFVRASLKQLVLDAKDAGKDTVTLMVAHNMDPDNQPGSFDNFNYIINPKDQTTLRNDTGYDSDTTDAIPPEGSPWSGADNSTGAFSPKLIIWVPEPGSFVLFGLGLAGLAMIRRRK